MDNGKFWFKKIAGFIICGLAIAALLGWVVMELWNRVMVDVLNVKAVTFWQALGILLLGKILFGGIHKKWGGQNSGHWNAEMKEKWQNISPEEKEKFKQSWRNKCSKWGRHNDEPTAGND